MIVDTTSPYGAPWCPICHIPVEVEGAFCSPNHWEQFHSVVQDMSEPIEMTYLDLEDQPWYGVHYG